MVELNGKKILVTFLMHLGDLTLTTPFIHALRKAAPDSHITMLVDEKLKDVVLFNPYLDEVVTIDKKGRDNSILSLWACSRHLSKLDFDVLINLHPNERCSFIDAMTSVKLRTGTTHKIFKWVWAVFTPLDRSLHAAGALYGAPGLLAGQFPGGLCVHHYGWGLLLLRPVENEAAAAA